MLEVKFKKLSKDAVIPAYSQTGDCGLDLTAVSREVVEEKGFGYISYKTDLAIEIPEGYVGLLFPRSSISKTGMILANSVGIIDSNFRGNIEARFKHVATTAMYEVGDRVAQLVILPYPQVKLIEVEELSDSERGSKGFGSSN